MQSTLNILWQKAKKSDLYRDIFTIRPLADYHLEPLIDQMFVSEKSAKNQKNNLAASLLREKGKIYFTMGKYMEAMNTFNSALKHAENGSDEVALAYANRSACFLHLNMPEECLFDIELAKKSKYPAHLMHKLDARASKCTALLIDKQFKDSRFTPMTPKLSFDEHKEFAGVVNCLEIRKNDEFGRHIVTTRDLQVGQTFLIEKPFAIIPMRFHGAPARVRCSHCFKACINLIPCKNCKGVSYCNEECMAMSFHKYECNMPISLSRKETFELLLRMFFNINAAFTDIDMLMKTVDTLLKGGKPDNLTTEAQRNFCSLFQLTHNHREMLEHQMDRFRAATDVAIITINRFPDLKSRFRTLKHQRFLQHLLLHLFHIAEHAVELYEYTQEKDSDSMSKMECERYAYAMYPFSCYINHSCLPNVWMYSVDDRLIGKVIRPIKKGEQLFRSYAVALYATEGLEQKRLAMDLQFHFKCKCFICTNKQWSSQIERMSLANDPLYKVGIKPYEMNTQAFRKQSRKTIEKQLKKATEFLEKHDHLHPVYDTMVMQGNLFGMWSTLTSRY